MDFHRAFEAIDTDGSGEIDVDELQAYMRKMNYKENFVQKWLNLFDEDESGTITYEEYCNTLGLIPKKEIVDKARQYQEQEKKSQNLLAAKTAESDCVEPVTVAKKLSVPSTSAGMIQKKVQKKRASAVRNQVLSGILMKYSRARIFQKKALYRMKSKHSSLTKETKKQTEVTFKEKEIGGEKNGSKRQVANKKSPGSYETHAVRKRKLHRKKKCFSEHMHKLRASITPGTVLILLNGRQRGKRVIFLKQLLSGLLLVSGPLKLNGCPLRRVNQKFVIATKTKLDISAVKVPSRVNDVYFRRAKALRKSYDTADIFQQEKKVYALTEERKQDQKEVDSQLVKAIKENPEKKLIFSYLESMFSLKNGQHPHRMVF